jgi:hypothetical protein
MTSPELALAKIATRLARGFKEMATHRECELASTGNDPRA